MKWFLKLLLVASLSLFSINSFADKKEYCEKLNEARNTNGVVDFSEFSFWDKFAICNGDYAAKTALIIDKDMKDEPVSVITFDFFGYNPELVVSTSSLSFFIDFIMNIFWFASVILFAVLIFLIAKYAYEKDKGKANDLSLKTVAIILMLGLLSNPVIFRGLINFINIVAIANMNGSISNGIDASFSYDEESRNKLEELPKNLSIYDRSDINLARIAKKEIDTKYQLIPVKAVPMSKGSWLGFMDASETKSEIFDIIENDIATKIVREYDEDGIVSRMNFVWREDFEKYDSKKFGSASILDSISSNNLESSDVDDDELLAKIKQKAQSDAATIMSAETTREKLNQYAEQSYELIKANETAKIKKIYDKELVSRVSDALEANLEIVKSMLPGNATHTELNAYTAAYVAVWQNSLEGFNDTDAMKVKYDFQKSAYIFNKIYNCSQKFEKLTETKYYIERVNSFNGLWVDIKDDALRLDWQCVYLNERKLILASIDSKTNADKVQEAIDKYQSKALALNVLKSNLKFATSYAQQRFAITASYYSKALAEIKYAGYTDTGRLLNVYRDKNSSDSSYRNAIYNSTAVNYSSLEENDKYLDYAKLYGDTDLEELNEDQRFTNFKSRIDNHLIDPFLVESKSSSFEQAKGKRASEYGAMDYIKNFFENNLTTDGAMKDFVGLDKNLTMNDGIRECLTTDNCVSRQSGTVADGLAVGGTAFNFMLTYSGVYATLNAVSKIKNLSKFLSKFGISDGKNEWVNTIAIIGGGLFFAILGLIQIMMAAFFPAVMLLGVVGFYVAYIIPLTIWLNFISIMIMLNLSIKLFIPLIIALFVLKIVIKRNIAYARSMFESILSELSVPFFKAYGSLIFLYLITNIQIGFLFTPMLENSTGGILGTIISPILMIVSVYLIYKMFESVPNAFVAIASRAIGKSSVDSPTNSDILTPLTAAITDAMLRQGILNSLDKLSNSADMEIAKRAEALKAKIPEEKTEMTGIKATEPAKTES